MLVAAFSRPQSYGDGVSGIPVRRAAGDAVRKFSGREGFVQVALLPELQRLGFIEQVVNGSSPAWRLTATGQIRKDELTDMLDRGRNEQTAWQHGDVQNAARLFDAAGTAALLLGDPPPAVWARWRKQLVAADQPGDSVEPTRPCAIIEKAVDWAYTNGPDVDLPADVS